MLFRILYGAIILSSILISGCEFEDKVETEKPKAESTPLPCAVGTMTTEDCMAALGEVVTTSEGTDVIAWNNPASSTIVSAVIPKGSYKNKMCRFDEPSLLPENIAAGVSVFGVTGTLNLAYAGCSDDSLNNSSCSTAANRYVYTSQNNGRSVNCSSALNATACWTNNTNRYTTPTAGGNVSGSNGLLSITIPAGYQDGTKTVTANDLNLNSDNIRSGVNIFGAVGTSYGQLGLYTNSNQHRDKTFTPVNLYTEAVTNKATAYTNSSSGYRAVPRVSKDDDGTMGTSHNTVNRTGWGATTCGTTQASVSDRIANCATVFGANATWDGAVNGNSGEGVWQLVTRTGNIASSKGREVWRDQRTLLLWSSLVATSINWCKASGSNNIVNNPTKEVDPNNFCSNSSYQNTGTGPGVKAVSACFEDGTNYFTTTDASIDNLGKAGLSLSSTPAVAWRLPTHYDYHIAEINGIRFVFPDMVAAGGNSYQWTATISSNMRDRAWTSASAYMQMNQTPRSSSGSVRCVGR